LSRNPVPFKIDDSMTSVENADVNPTTVSNYNKMRLKKLLSMLLNEI